MSFEQTEPVAGGPLPLLAKARVTESCTSNLAVRLGGRWWTPPLGSGCLTGVERAGLVHAGEPRMT